MANKNLAPSFLEGLFKKNMYIWLVLVLLLFVLGLKYLMYGFWNGDGDGAIESFSVASDSDPAAPVHSDVSDEVSEAQPETIPKIIIQTWKNKNIPSKYKPLQQGLIEKNPDYKYVFMTDEDIDAFLKSNYPEYYTTFNKLPVLIQKIDFFRYIAIYHYGGFYFDLDMQCLEPLDDALLKHNTIIPVDDRFSQSKKDLNRQWMEYKGENILLGQYAFGAVKHSPFMKFLVDNIHTNIDSIITYYDTRVKNNVSNFEYFVYSTTGPDYVSFMYKNYYKKWEVFILEHPIRQYFGKYARHRYFGTWKNNTNN